MTTLLSKGEERRPHQSRRDGVMSEAQPGGVAMSSVEQGDGMMPTIKPQPSTSSAVPI